MRAVGSDVVKKTYIYANSQIIAQHDGDTDAGIYFYLHDRLGSVRQIIDNDADVVNRYTYRPFGKMFIGGEREEGITDNRFRFAGQWLDDEIRQYYMRARQYDTNINRFTSRDPVLGEFEEPLTLHVYLYCLNDPINWVDPLGLRRYSYEETQQIIEEATKLVGEFPFGPFKTFGPGMDHDYKARWPNAEFEILKNRQSISASDFGNYLAGYTAYYNYGWSGEVILRQFGHMDQACQAMKDLFWDWKMPESFADDYDSRFFITTGILHANIKMRDEGKRGHLEEMDEIRIRIMQIYYWVMTDDIIDNLPLVF